MTSPYTGSDITMLKSTLKNPIGQILFNSAKRFRRKTTSFLTGNDVTVHRKWHHHVEKHPQKTPYANFCSIRPNGSREKTTFGLTGNDVTVHRKWHHHVESHSQKPPYSEFHPIWPSDSGDIPVWDYFGTFLVCDINMVPRTPATDIAMLESTLKNFQMPNYIQFGQAIPEILQFETILVLLPCGTNVIPWK